MTDDLRPPYRIAFDNARDPYTARNALGILSTGGGGGVPTTRNLTAGAGLTGGGDLSADRTFDVGAGTGITVNANDVALTVPVSVANGGTGSTTVGGALTSLGAQPLDADLTAIAALTGTNVIYYRSAADTWSAVTIGANLTFSGGTLAATGGGGTPGGSTTQVQFNDGGAFGGDADLIWNKTTNLLTVNGNISITGGVGNSLQANAAIQGSLFRCLGTVAIFGSELTSGVVNLRPNTVANSTGQFQVQSSGTVVVANNIELGGATDATLSRVSAGVVAIEGQNILTAATGQPLDADLTAIAALTGTNTIYYRSAANTWSAVAVGTGLSFSSGTLAATGGGGADIPSNFLGGLTLSNNVSDASNDIDTATGAAVDATNAVIMRLTSSITKQLDAAWAVGTNAGGRDTGSIADGTWHVWLIRRSDTGVVDVLFSLSATAPTMPTNYDQKRRIGAIIRQTSIIAFRQYGDWFYYVDGILDVSVVNQGNARVLRTLTVPPSTIALLRGFANNTAAYNLVVHSVYETDATASGSAAPLLTFSGLANNPSGAGTMAVPVDASSQIATRASVGSTTLRILTLGWIDTRGK